MENANRKWERGQPCLVPFCNGELVRVVSVESDLSLGVRVEGLRDFNEARAKAPSL